MINKRLVILNILLAGGIVLAGLNLRDNWRMFESQHRTTPIQADEVAGLPAMNTKPLAARVSPDDWMEAARKNPFSFDRSDAELIVTDPEEEKAKEVKVPATPKPILYGVFAIGGDRIAMLGQSRSSSRAAMAAKVGQSFDGWEVVEIHDKTAIVMSNGRRESLIMNDPTAQVAREYSKTSSAGSQSMVTTASSAKPPVAAEDSAKSSTPFVIVPPPADSTEPKKAQWIQTPFGPKLVEVPKQQ